MSCPRLSEAFSDTPALDFAAHRASCSECHQARQAYEAVAAGASAAPVSPDAPALRALAHAARAELAAHPVARRWWLDAVALVAACAGTFACAAVMMPWSHSQHRSSAAGVAVAVAWAAVMLAAGALAVAPLALRWRQLLLPLAGLAALATLWGASQLDLGRPLWSGVGCAAIELALAAAPLAVALWALTRFAFEPLRALAAGLAAASAGLLAQHLHCPNGGLNHLVLFHLGPVALVSVLAPLVRRGMTSRSHAP